MRAYLDHAASTPMRPEAVAAMAPFLTERFANPSGAHTLAQRSKAALEEARERCAALLGAAAGELVFTGGGTEADNLAVIGAARAAREAGRVAQSSYRRRGAPTRSTELQLHGSARKAGQLAHDVHEA